MEKFPCSPAAFYTYPLSFKRSFTIIGFTLLYPNLPSGNHGFPCQTLIKRNMIGWMEEVASLGPVSS